MDLGKGKRIFFECYGNHLLQRNITKNMISAKFQKNMKIFGKKR